MSAGWYGRSVANRSLTRLPQAIACGLCGLTEPTPEDAEGNAAAWATMTRHVMDAHCTACCDCGSPATGLIELRTGGLAPWVRRPRAPSALHALRARRRVAAREREREREREARAAKPPSPPSPPWTLLDGVRDGIRDVSADAGYEPITRARFRARAARGAPPASPLPGSSALLRARVRRGALGTSGCTHCACEACARRAAERAAASGDGKTPCPARECGASLDVAALAALLPAGAAEAARSTRTFSCVACGDEVADRDTIALHRQPPYHALAAYANADPPRARGGAPASACDLCAPCAARWLKIQGADGAVYARCPTPSCKQPLPRETLELLLEPEAYEAHLGRARQSYEARLRELQRAAGGDGETPPDGDGTLAFLEWAGDSTRACPDCHVLIYRSEGCAHMSCACGAEFNWDNAERVGAAGAGGAPAPEVPAESAADPAMAALLRAGWAPFTAIAALDAGDQRLAAPPLHSEGDGARLAEIHASQRWAPDFSRNYRPEERLLFSNDPDSLQRALLLERASNRALLQALQELRRAGGPVRRSPLDRARVGGGGADLLARPAPRPAPVSPAEGDADAPAVPKRAPPEALEAPLPKQPRGAASRRSREPPRS